MFQLPSKIKSAIRDVGGYKEEKNKTEPEKSKSTYQKSYNKSSNNTRAQVKESSPQGTTKVMKKDLEYEQRQKKSSSKSK